ncbi:SHOCT domain-containing protein [Gordonia sp. ABSL1-1]|uniref:SHOCT domain-containing protein n=1 Tax=Gordonia sp. ABSL1-1 TaxID=3053923 RepID=UPI00257351CE|nr:SHOCT domain-containing protein [Gordonia sp. ABSL1-1]MDL9938131.1 SHOCT domain-containing protein [Gordonia sp. ABSL1-1]
MPGLLRGVVRTAAVAGTATAVRNGVSRRQANRWAQQDSQQAQAAVDPGQFPQAQTPVTGAPPAPPAPVAGPSTIDQLKDLGALYQQGILTEDEFAAQKAKILGS